MIQPAPHNPAHYWRLANEMLEKERFARLRSMGDTDGLQVLIRLTKGSRIQRENDAQKESELLITSALFQAAYSRKRHSTA